MTEPGDTGTEEADPTEMRREDMCSGCLEALNSSGDGSIQRMGMQI